jgi:hypothetical protein
MATDNPWERLDLRHALAQVRERHVTGFAPALTIDGDTAVYGFTANGTLTVERDGVLAGADEQTLAGLYDREIAALIQRQRRYGAPA